MRWVIKDNVVGLDELSFWNWPVAVGAIGMVLCVVLGCRESCICVEKDSFVVFTDVAVNGPVAELVSTWLLFTRVIFNMEEECCSMWAVS